MHPALMGRVMIMGATCETDKRTLLVYVAAGADIFDGQKMGGKNVFSLHEVLLVK